MTVDEIAVTAQEQIPARDETGTSPPHQRRWRPKASHIVYALVIVIIAYLVGTPLIYLLWGTFFDANGFTLAAFGRAFGDASALDTVWNTVAFSVGGALVALVIGTALAYLQARTDVPMKGLLFAASLTPLILAPVVYAAAWVFLYGADVGIISGLLAGIFGSSPIDAYGLGGMIMASGLHLVPIVFLFMVPAFRSMDPSLEEAARVAGANWWTVLTRITLRLSRPALASSAVIILVLGLEAFEIPVMLGETKGVHVFTGRIYFLMHGYPADLGAAGAVAMAIMAIAIVLMYCTGVGGASKRENQTVTGKAFRPTQIELGRARPWAVAGILVYFLVAVILPVLALLYVSLSPFYQMPSWDAILGLRLDNYFDLANVRGIGPAIVNTVLIALVSATVVMILTTITSWYVVRSNFVGRRILDNLALVPLVIPGLVLGLGLMSVYLRSPLPIYGSIFILMIAYVTRFLPYGMRYAGSAMGQIGNELEEAALVSGASWWTTLRRVVLPLSASGILSGWIFVMLVSFRELSSTVLLAGPKSDVLSVILFRQFNEGTLGVVAALSILMVVIVSVIIAAAYVIGSRFGAKVNL